MAVDFYQKLPEAIKAYEPEAVSLRRALHKIPETGFNERETQAFIMDYLEKLGYTPEKLCDTGVVLFIPSLNGLDETIAIRTDMDGLGVVEETGVDFASEHEGMMHACGHDGHMSMVLLVARYLKEHPEARVPARRGGTRRSRPHCRERRA